MGVSKNCVPNNLLVATPLENSTHWEQQLIRTAKNIQYQEGQHSRTNIKWLHRSKYFDNFVPWQSEKSNISWHSLSYECRSVVESPADEQLRGLFRLGPQDPSKILCCPRRKASCCLLTQWWAGQPLHLLSVLAQPFPPLLSLSFLLFSPSFSFLSPSSFLIWSFSPIK